MNGDEVIQNGTIVIHENRIEAVGAANEVDVPEGAYVMDAAGKTVMPGFVDAHAHIGNFRSGLSPNQQWELPIRSEEHTSELQSRGHLVCRLLLGRKNS